MDLQLTQYLSERASFDKEALLHINAHFKHVKFKRGEMLCRVGEICRHFYFIKKGCLRLYEIDSKGNEVTGYFALEDSIMTALPGFIMQKPSRDFLEAYEASEALVISRSEFFMLTEKYKPFYQIYHQFIEFGFIHSQMRIYSFLGMEGMDKLKWVMEHEPKLLTRVSSKAVASYLGMTNSTLSKLRAKL